MPNFSTKFLSKFLGFGAAIEIIFHERAVPSEMERPNDVWGSSRRSFFQLFGQSVRLALSKDTKLPTLFGVT